MYKIKYYEETDKKIWDEFVLGNECINGTFLQSRNFLNYHPKDRFIDRSIIIYNEKETIIAVCPACEIVEDNKKIFYSHKGSTYGGLIIRKNYYQTAKVIEIIESFESFIKEQGFNKIILKITPDLFAKQNTDLLQYVLFYKGYDQYTELSTYVDLKTISNDIISSLNTNKKRNIKKCISNNLEFKALSTTEEIKTFHQVLALNLTKYNTKPVHTDKELIEFYKNRLVDIVQFYAVFYKHEQVAGSMVFYFKQTNVWHTQYLSSVLEDMNFSPSTFLYYSLIKLAKESNIDKLSWGIATENEGKEINLGLIRNKESYNSKHSLNRTFYKVL